MTRRSVLLLCLAVAGVALGVMFTRTSDEDRIRKVLQDFAAVVAVKEGDTVLTRGGRVKGSMKELVDDDVHVNISELSLDVRGREKFETSAIKAGLLYQKAECDLTSLSIKVDPGATVATVESVAVVAASGGGEHKVDKRNVHFLLRKDAEWKIATIDVAPKAVTP